MTITPYEVHCSEPGRFLVTNPMQRSEMVCLLSLSPAARATSLPGTEPFTQSARAMFETSLTANAATGSAVHFCRESVASWELRPSLSLVQIRRA